MLNIEVTFLSGISQETDGVLKLKEVFELIRNPTKQDLEIINQLRNGDNSNKTNLNSYVFGAIFNNNRRRKEDLKTGTGLMILDFDHLDDPERIKRSFFEHYPFIVAAFISPSGDGVKFIIKIPIVTDYLNYKKYYLSLYNELKGHPGLDSSGKDITRLCFTSYDPDILVREPSDTWDIIDKAEDISNAIELNSNQKVVQSIENKNFIYDKFKTAFKQDNIHPLHEHILKHANLMGGYVAAGYLSKEEAIIMLHGFIDENDFIDRKGKRKATVEDGIEYGIKSGAVYLVDAFQNSTDTLESRHFTIDSFFEEDDPLIYVRGQKAMSLGNFSVITGKPKAGKGFTLALIVNGFLNSENIQEAFSSTTETRKRVIHIDTEQAPVHAKRLMNTVANLGGNADKIDGYWLRGISPDKVVEYTEKLIKSHSKEASLFIIDGIRDLSTKGVNDEEESTKIFVKLLDWTQKYNIHIIVVIHQNKADNNATGFLGGDMVKKCETNLSVTKNKNTHIHTIAAEDTRDAPLDNIQFKIDNDSVPRTLNSPEKRSMAPESMSVNKLRSIAQKIYESKTILNSGQLVSALKKELSVGETKAKDFKKMLVERGIINEGGNKAYREYSLREDYGEDIRSDLF